MPKGIRVKWNDAPIFRSTKKDIVSRMGLVVQVLRAEVIKDISRTQSYHRTSGGHRVGLDPSKPGEPPKRLHGDLMRSIVTDVQEEGTAVRGRYGSTQTKKAIGLEFGTSKLGARPFLRPPLLRNRDRVQRMLSE